MFNLLTKTIGSIKGLLSPPQQVPSTSPTTQTAVGVAPTLIHEGASGPLDSEPQAELLMLPSPNLLGEQFATIRALKLYLRNFCRGGTTAQPIFAGYSMSTLRSRRRGKYIRFVCSRGLRLPQRRAGNNQQRRYRPTSLCGCPFAIEARKADEGYTATIINPYHNHQPSLSMEKFASLRSPTLEELETAGLSPQHLLSIPPRAALETIRHALNRQEITMKDFYNLRPKLRRLL